jgi:ABC-type transporter Mla MlaB component
MPIATKQLSDSCVLLMSGDIALQDVAESKQAFVAALKASDRVIIDLHEISGIDFAGLQLICSAHRTSAKLGKSMAFSGKPPALLTDVAEKSGFSRRRRCAFGSDSVCLLKGAAYG